MHHVSMTVNTVMVLDFGTTKMTDVIYFCDSHSYFEQIAVTEQITVPPNAADGMASSAEPDHILVYTFCSGLPVRTLRKITKYLKRWHLEVQIYFNIKTAHSTHLDFKK